MYIEILIGLITAIVLVLIRNYVYHRMESLPERIIDEDIIRLGLGTLSFINISGIAISLRYWYVLSSRLSFNIFVNLLILFTIPLFYVSFKVTGRELIYLIIALIPWIYILGLGISMRILGFNDIFFF
jgi:hypothetical protein